MPYTLPTLPYAYNALEPHFDAQTMEIHHSKHHAAYVNNLNKALETAGVTPDPNACIYSFIAKLNDLPEAIRPAVRNNGGGHANHSFFWPLLTPHDGKHSKPTGKLLEKIEEHFKSFDQFKETFTQAATTRFGSGWAWLILQPSGALAVTSTPNQDHPCMPVAETYGWPILGLDVWEHSYYLKYQNRRPDYIAAFWNVVNWNEANQYFEAGEQFFSGKKDHYKTASA
jgi:Fe-Mn family superoxide dismutase